MDTLVNSYDPSIDQTLYVGPDYNIPKNMPYVDKGNASDDTNPADAEPYTSQENASAKRPIANVVPRLLPPLKGRYKLIQLWEGRVVEVREEEFDAIIRDKVNTDFADEFVTLERSEVHSDDEPLLAPGAVFYWSIGYLDYPGRGRARESKIRFRRLKGFSKKDIAAAKEAGRKFAEFFRSNSGHSADSR